ncbi:hypothetical protein AB6802_21990 [Mesorhizobium sp. RCC_202]|uniref:hypothetical protein n=1 Tax=Mesorhizobium sp. RCC_202 TaxID=3239222 RepID=UPI00352426F2
MSATAVAIPSQRSRVNMIAAGRLERFTVSWKRRPAPDEKPLHTFPGIAVRLDAIPDEKPLHTFPGIAVRLDAIPDEKPLHTFPGIAFRQHNPVEFFHDRAKGRAIRRSLSKIR